MSVGVMKDYKLKQRDLLSSHTLGWSWNWNWSRSVPEAELLKLQKNGQFPDDPVRIKV